MKFGVGILVIVGLAGCSSDGVPSLPTAPASVATTSPTTGSALLWVMVIEESGACVDGATIQIVGAQAAGEPVTQTTPCAMWDVDGGLLLRNLTPGVELTLRAAATGYRSRDMTFLPFPTPGPYYAVFITLSPYAGSALQSGWPRSTADSVSLTSSPSKARLPVSIW